MRFPALTALALATMALACASADSAPLLRVAQQARQVAPAEDPLDINTATLEQLTRLPGMTRTWAARIIRFRPYRAKNELVDRGIVTGEVYTRIKNHIIAHRTRN